MKQRPILQSPNLFLIVFFLLTIILSSIPFGVTGQDSHCHNTTLCLGNGDSCLDQNNIQLGVCQNFTYCNPTTKTCQVRGNDGDQCNSDIQCQDWLGCHNNTCIQYHYAAFGDYCKINDNCWMGLSCIEGKCLNSITNCTTGQNCPFTHYCNSTTGLCMYRLPDMEPCEESISCETYSSCIGGICSAPFSRQLNEPCEPEGLLPTCDLSQGLYCDHQEHVCAKYNSTPTPPTFNCYTAECPNHDETCVCVSRPGQVGQGFSGQGMCVQTAPISLQQIQTCGQATKDYWQCMINNQCSDYAVTPNSCTIEKCGHQFCIYESLCNYQFNIYRVSPSFNNSTIINDGGDYDLCYYLDHKHNSSSSSDNNSGSHMTTENGTGNITTGGDGSHISSSVPLTISHFFNIILLLSSCCGSILI